MVYTSGDVMDLAAVLMNDAPKSLYNYTVQLPFLKMVNQELEHFLDLNECPLNLISEYESTVLVGETSLSLPESFFIPISLMERPSGSVLDADYIPMYERTNINDLKRGPTSILIDWDYRHNCINFIGSTANRTVRLCYWRILTITSDEGSIQPVRGAQNFLAHRTAAKLAQYIAKDEARATDLNNDAGNALDLILSIFIKNNQNLRVRRKPFSISNRSYFN